MATIKRLPKRLVTSVNQAVNTVFERVKAQALGPGHAKDKRLVMGFMRSLSLPGVFEQAAKEEGSEADTDLLDSALRVAANYIDSAREKAKARVLNEINAHLREGSLGKLDPDEFEDKLRGSLQDVWTDVTEQVHRIIDTEASHVKNLGLLDGIQQVNAERGIADPTVFFIIVRDNDVCIECLRLHTVDDWRPRVWKLSDIGHGYHERGDDSPKLGGLHPHCRCVLATLLPGFGFNDAGKVTYIERGHDEYAEQRSMKKSDLRKTRDTLADVSLDLIDHANRRTSPGEHLDDRGALIDRIRETLAAGGEVPRPRIYLDPVEPESGRYHVFDGNTRLTAYREHGSKTVPVQVIPSEQVMRYWDKAYGTKKSEKRRDKPATPAWTVDEKGWKDVEHWPPLRDGYERTVLPISDLFHMGFDERGAVCGKHPNGCGEYVAKLAQALKTKRPFSPVVAYPDASWKYVANDGNHRIAAALLNGHTHVPVALAKAKAKMQKSESIAELPPEPGTAPIKPGHVRLYHQTNAANLDGIRRDGLLLSQARGIEGPRAIYAAKQPFYGSADQHPTIEFQVPESDLQGNFVVGSRRERVPPSDFIGIHEPWHGHARYMEAHEDVRRAVLAGEHDSMLDWPNHGPALRYIKQKYGTLTPDSLAKMDAPPAQTRKLYHLTDNADFKLDPNHQPVNNTTLGGKFPKGVFLADDVEPWVNGYGYWRPWVAEFEAPNNLHQLPGVMGGKGQFGLPKGYSGESFVPAEHYDKLRMTRVVPLDAWCRENYGEHGWTEQWAGKEFDTGKPIPPGHVKTRGYRFEGDARQWPVEQRRAYARQVRAFSKQRTNAIAKSEDLAKMAPKAGPKYGYHWTESEFVPSIREKGLLPRGGPGKSARYPEFDNALPVTYFVDHEEMGRQYGRESFGAAPGEGVLLRFPHPSDSEVHLRVNSGPRGPYTEYRTRLPIPRGQLEVWSPEGWKKFP